MRTGVLPAAMFLQWLMKFTTGFICPFVMTKQYPPGIKTTKKNNKKMEKLRLQIAFDIKDEQNRSVLCKDAPNTVSRSVFLKPTDEQVENLYRSILINALSLCQESRQFRSLFYLEIPDVYVRASDCEKGKYIEIPAEFQGYRSLIHSKGDNRLNPFVNKELLINRDVFSKIRLLRRKIRYYWKCLCELIRL
jgi:hypothetical protein